MFELLWQRLDSGARSALPFVTTLLCVFLGTIVWPLPYLGSVAPPLVIVTLYYWSLHRPDLLTPSGAFIIGLLTDIVNFLPLGLSAFLFVGINQLVFTQRRYVTGQPFLTLWAGFALTAFLTALAEWILLAVLRQGLTPVLPAMIQTLLVIAIFPIPCWLLIRLQRTALSQG